MDLDDLAGIRRLDPERILASIEKLPSQCQQAWEETKKVRVPVFYKQKVKNIVIIGMGGSALGPHVVQSLFFDQLRVPLQIVNDYHLPAYTDDKTLVILSSNSGSTEEVLAAAQEAIGKKTMMMGMTTGGKLAGLLRERQVPAYIFEQKHNPSDQPRMSTGYMVLGMAGLLRQLGVIDVDDQRVSEAIKFLREVSEQWRVRRSEKVNNAKQAAQKLRGRVVILIGAQFLTGSVHAFCNQLNENAKNMASYFALPELNHHLMEGLGFPSSNKSNLVSLFINSGLYDKRLQLRFELTEEVMQKNGIEVVKFRPTGSTRLKQVLEVLSWGSYVGFYLAMLNNLNPCRIPWVDHFKKQLAARDA